MASVVPQRPDCLPRKGQKGQGRVYQYSCNNSVGRELGPGTHANEPEWMKTFRVREPYRLSASFGSRVDRSDFMRSSTTAELYAPYGDQRIVGTAFGNAPSAKNSFASLSDQLVGHKLVDQVPIPHKSELDLDLYEVPSLPSYLNMTAHKSMLQSSASKS